MCNIDWSKYMFDSEADSTESVEAFANIFNDLTDCKIFFTLNSHIEKTMEEYRSVIKEVIRELRKKYAHEAVAEWYFEDKTKDGLPTRLHVHGMISGIPEKYCPYNYLTDWISKQFHKLIGKYKNRHNISAKVEWANSNKQVEEYCRKQGKLDFQNVVLLLNT